MKKYIKYIIWILIIIIVVIGISAAIFVKHKIDNKQDGFQLILEAHYGGTGPDGSDLGTGTKLRKYNNLKVGDKFYEPFIGGAWECNIPSEKALKSDDNPNGSDMGYRKIIEITKLDNNSVKFKEYYYGKENESEVKYEDEYKLKGPNVTDGLNYTYVIKFHKP